MAALDYRLTFAGVPFLNDDSRAAGMGEGGAARHKPLSSLLSHLDNRFTLDWDRDASPPVAVDGRAYDALARTHHQDTGPGPKRLGDYYYPHGACRWSIFRMLATGLQVRAMLAAAPPGTAGTFVMESVPKHGATGGLSYTVTTSLYMLPAKPLFAHVEAADGIAPDGLYLVTLVDERYFWKQLPAESVVTPTSTWAGMFTLLGAALGVTLTHTAIDARWLSPEQDSQLYSPQGSAASLLDAAAANVGRAVVRNLDGTYSLLRPSESAARAAASRGALQSAGAVIRQGGGDRPVGWADAVTPSTVTVAFPKYAQSPPGFVDPRGGAGQFSRDNYGAVWTVAVPLASGGSATSGASGNGRTEIVRDTAKAVYALASASSGDPLNAGALRDLAVLVGTRHWENVRLSALDEAYPGTLAWTPDGLHDIVWSWSEQRQDASCRVQRREWAGAVRDMQHATPVSGGLSVPFPECCPTRTTSGTISGTIIVYEPPVLDPPVSGLYAGTVVLTPGAPSTIQGFDLEPGQKLTLVNGGSGLPIILDGVPEGTAGFSGYLRTPGGGDVVLGDWDRVTLYRDPATGLVTYLDATNPPAKPPTYLTAASGAVGSGGTGLAYLPPGTSELVFTTPGVSPVPVHGFYPPTTDAPITVTVPPTSPGPVVIRATSGQSGRVLTPGLTDITVHPGTSLTLYQTQSGYGTPQFVVQSPLTTWPYKPTLSSGFSGWVSIPPGADIFAPTLGGPVWIAGLSGLTPDRQVTVQNPSAHVSGYTMTLPYASGASGSVFSWTSLSGKVLTPGDNVTFINGGTATRETGSSLSLIPTGSTPATPPTTVTLTSVPAWFLVKTFTAADLSDADTSQTVTAYTLPAKGTLGGMQLRTKTVATGGGVGSLTLQPVVGGGNTGAVGNGVVADDLSGGFAGSAAVGNGLFARDWASTTTVAVTFDADVNLDTITGGEWECYLLLATLG